MEAESNRDQTALATSPSQKTHRPSYMNCALFQTLLVLSSQECRPTNLLRLKTRKRQGEKRTLHSVKFGTLRIPEKVESVQYNQRMLLKSHVLFKEMSQSTSRFLGPSSFRWPQKWRNTSADVQNAAICFRQMPTSGSFREVNPSTLHPEQRGIGLAVFRSFEFQYDSGVASCALQL